MATTVASRQPERPTRRKKEARSDIWSSLLRQTREAQARSRTHAVQHRSLVLCGGAPDDQRSFLASLTRPPPSQQSSRSQEKRQQRPKGELKLSNRYAYGYGHVTLYSPPQQSGSGVQVLGAEAEEAARVEVHTLPEAGEEYVGALRHLLQRRSESQDHGNEDKEGFNSEEKSEDEERGPAVCILLSWKEPWKFLDQLRRWTQLLAAALLQPGILPTDPMDMIKDSRLSITVVVQNTEAQEDLFREGYKEEDFDYISQCLRTAILPLHPLSALVYTSSSAPPQQPGGLLTEVQKVVYSSLDLDLGTLSPKAPRSGDSAKKDEFAPKHEFMDRMAIVIPAGWDSAAFIRTLSETFAPEDMLAAWLTDVQPLHQPTSPPEAQTEETKTETNNLGQANGGAEVYESSPVNDTPDDLSEPPLSPSKVPPSAMRIYESKVIDPQAHKQQKPPQIEVTTKPDQKFLAEMREHLQQLESHDREREASGRSTGVSTTSLSSGRMVGMPTGEQTGALNELGDVSFNVGGVSYDTISAEAAIERLRRPPTTSDSRSPLSPSPRTTTPKPPRANRDYSEDRRPSADRGTPATTASGKSTESKELPINELDKFFQSLMKGGSGGSRNATPTKKSGEEHSKTGAADPTG